MRELCIVALRIKIQLYHPIREVESLQQTEKRNKDYYRTQLNPMQAVSDLGPRQHHNRDVRLIRSNS
jgi:hypothetical protein